MHRYVSLALVALFLAGCTSTNQRLVEPADTGIDLADVKVTSVRTTSWDVASFDGTRLSTAIVEPVTTDRLRDGSEPRWPVVVFLHGWGGSKESWMGSTVPGSPLQPDPATGNNTLEEWAWKGFLAVAYDARGFGQSGGLVGVAGPDEVRDLQAVIRVVEDRFPTNGFVGVYGSSYGAGQALQAISTLAEVDAVVARYGWSDLYDALVPGHVPRLAWAEALYVGGIAPSAGRYQPFIHDWYTRLYTRADMAELEADMDLRSGHGRLGHQEKPLLVCQGMQESLFPQIDQIWAEAGGFTRAVVVTGGHGLGMCPGDLEFFQFFLQGRDTAVDAWPALRTVDAAGGPTVSFDTFPESVFASWYLRDGELAPHASPTRFTVEQRFVANPVAEPGFVWDRTQSPHAAIPAELRQDPTGHFFAGPVLDEAALLLGAAQLRLHSVTTTTPYQVVATLFLERDGSWITLSRGAAAVIDGQDAPGGLVDVRLPWTKAQLEPGDRLVLKVASNDPSTFMPLLEDYSVTFDGESRLDLPYFVG